MSRKLMITWVLALATFAAMVSAFTLAPLLKDIGAEFGVSDSVVGQLATLQAVISAVVALLAAPLLDRYPRRAALQFECLVLAAATLLTAVAPSFGWLLAARALAGIGGAMIFGVCLAATGDLFPDPTERNRRIGLLLSAASMAAVIGTPIVAQLNDLAGWRWAAGSPAILLLLAAAGTVLLPASAAFPRAAPFWSDYRARVSQVINSRETTWLLGVQVCLLATWSGFEIYIAAYFETDFGAGASAVSIAFAVIGISFMLGSNLMPHIVERWPKRPMHVVTCALMAINFAAVGVLYTSLPSAMVFAALIALLMAGAFTMTSILSIDSLPSARGAVMALQSAANQSGVAIGAAWAGAALAEFGNYPATYRSLGLLMPIAMLCLLMSVRALRRAAPLVESAEGVALEPAR